MTHQKPEENAIDRPPVFKSWRQMYWLVFAGLVVQILLFYGITQYYK
jgi:uncharacterized protein CbrC (UPF0167 family)